MTLESGIQTLFWDNRFQQYGHVWRYRDRFESMWDLPGWGINDGMAGCMAASWG